MALAASSLARPWGLLVGTRIVIAAPGIADVRRQRDANGGPLGPVCRCAVYAEHHDVSEVPSKHISHAEQPQVDESASP
jgi:hypothetical protein